MGAASVLPLTQAETARAARMDSRHIKNHQLKVDLEHNRKAIQDVYLIKTTYHHQHVIIMVDLSLVSLLLQRMLLVTAIQVMEAVTVITAWIQLWLTQIAHLDLMLQFMILTQYMSTYREESTKSMVILLQLPNTFLQALSNQQFLTRSAAG